MSVLEFCVGLNKFPQRIVEAQRVDWCLLLSPELNKECEMLKFPYMQY